MAFLLSVVYIYREAEFVSFLIDYFAYRFDLAYLSRLLQRRLLVELVVSLKGEMSTRVQKHNPRTVEQRSSD